MPNALFFTVWMEFGQLVEPHNQFAVGIAYVTTSAAHELSRPTLDATFEVVEDDSVSTALARRDP